MISIIVPTRNPSHLKELQDSFEKLFVGLQVIISLDQDGKGKGWALRQGLERATGNAIGFIDSDMDIDPRMLLRLLSFLVDYDIVVGKKSLGKVLFTRKIVTFLSRIYIKLLFGVNVDTQTGIKLFRRSALPTWETDGFGCDLEILAKAKRAGKTMIEVPIEARISERTTCRAILRTLRESLRIRFSLL